MAIGRISGPMLYNNLDRQGVNLSIDGNLIYADVSNRYVGIGTAAPGYALDAPGTARLANLLVIGNQISSNTGIVSLGGIDNVAITGGVNYNLIYTNGSGTLAFGNLVQIVSQTNFTGNSLALGASPHGNDAYGTNALTTGQTVSDAITTLDNILGNITNTSGNVITTGNLFLTGGQPNYILTTNGAGQTSWANLQVLSGLENFTGNNLTLGSNTAGALVSNAVTLTTSTSVTNGLAQINYVLGKLVPPSPPPFPGANTLVMSSSTTTALMCNFTQTDNTGWANCSVSGGTSVAAVRSTAYTTSTSTITNVGPGNTGTVTAYLNGASAGSVVLTGSNSNTTSGNLYVFNVQDYHNVQSTVTAGFWSVFSTYALGTAPAGWNVVWIGDSYTGSICNYVKWYADTAAPGTPTFSNTSVTLTSNSTTYSSTIPHFNSGSTFKIKGNVANLSGDMYLASPFGTSAGGAFATPTIPTYSSFVPSISTPLSRNYLTSSYFETPVSITTGFSSSSTGPTVTFNNSYGTGTSSAIAPGVTVLYKTGTSTQIEETAITNNYTGGSAAYRIVNPDAGTATDNPAYSGSEATWNSSTSTLLITDATVVAARLQYDVTNYSTGYLPIGPNLSSGRAASQYFTFKFVKSAVSKFDIKYTGTLAGLWVALPGSTIDTTALPTNGWINVAGAYAGSGVPGTGVGGNGSTGCSTGGAAILNSAQTNKSVTCTFGTASSTTSTGNEIYVRVKLTSGQSLTAISIENPVN